MYILLNNVNLYNPEFIGDVNFFLSNNLSSGTKLNVGKKSKIRKPILEYGNINAH